MNRIIARKDIFNTLCACSTNIFLCKALKFKFTEILSKVPLKDILNPLINIISVPTANKVINSNLMQEIIFDVFLNFDGKISHKIAIKTAAQMLMAHIIAKRINAVKVFSV